MDKIRVIKLSLRCLRYGLLGLIPVIGIPFIITAFICYGRARREAGGEWNPARRQLYWGVGLAITDLLLLSAAIVLISVAVFQAYH